MNKKLSLLLAAAMLTGTAAFAMAAPADYAGREPGVTVVEDAASPTGYSAVFVYDSNQVDAAALGLKDITGVTLYSDCMKLYSYEEQTAGTIDGAFGHMPEEYAEGLYPCGGSGATRLDVALEELGEGLFGCTVPLSSGAFVYNYTLTDSDGNSVSRLSDPSNPAAVNEATGHHDLSSMVYVPYNAEKQNKDPWADRSVELPRTDGRNGTVQNVAYTGVEGDLRGLSIYLPYGYDANREEPYKVLYISHGTGSDLYGEEMRWLNEGAVANIMDNLEGDFVVVGMNNQDFAISGAGKPDWDYTKVEADQFQAIMPFVEANYNVAKDVSGRAYAGLSMGGCMTSNMLLYHAEEFGWFGIWSYANFSQEQSYNSVPGLDDAERQAYLTGLEKKPNIMLAYGSWDFGMGAVKAFGEGLSALGYTYSELEVPAAHDWECWQLTYAWALQNFLFK